MLGILQAILRTYRPGERPNPLAGGRHRGREPGMLLGSGDILAPSLGLTARVIAFHSEARQWVPLIETFSCRSQSRHRSRKLGRKQVRLIGWERKKIKPEFSVIAFFIVGFSGDRRLKELSERIIKVKCLWRIRPGHLYTGSAPVISIDRYECRIRAGIPSPAANSKIQRGKCSEITLRPFPFHNLIASGN